MPGQAAGICAQGGAPGAVGAAKLRVDARRFRLLASGATTWRRTWRCRRAKMLRDTSLRPSSSGTAPASNEQGREWCVLPCSKSSACRQPGRAPHPGSGPATLGATDKHSPRRTSPPPPAPPHTPVGCGWGGST